MGHCLHQMIRYYQVEKGYVATDSNMCLHAHASSVGNTLVFGRGPIVDGDTNSITDQVFNPQSLRTEVDAKDMPLEWQVALGYVPVKSPVKTGGLSHSSGSPDLTTHDAEQDRGPARVASVLVFMFGVFVGLVLAYFVTI